MDNLIIVGIKDDNGKVGHMRVFESFTWAKKYADAAGEFAVYIEVDTESNGWYPWTQRS